MQRVCPNCTQRSIAVRDLLGGRSRCPACGMTVRINRAVSFLFSILILAVTLVTSYMVLSMYGIYAVVVWFIFPIGAIGYLRARYGPLSVVPPDQGQENGH